MEFQKSNQYTMFSLDAKVSLFPRKHHAFKAQQYIMRDNNKNAEVFFFFSTRKKKKSAVVVVFFFRECSSASLLCSVFSDDERGKQRERRDFQRETQTLKYSKP